MFAFHALKVRSALKFKQRITEEAQNYLEQVLPILPSTNRGSGATVDTVTTVGIHVRRGDKLKLNLYRFVILAFVHSIF